VDLFNDDVTDTTGIDGSSVDTLIEDPDDYRWNTTEASEDVNWDFFSWVARGVTDVDDEFVTPIETVGVDDAVSLPTTITAENINADDTQLLDEAIVIWGLDDWGSLHWAVGQ